MGNILNEWQMMGNYQQPLPLAGDPILRSHVLEIMGWFWVIRSVRRLIPLWVFELAIFSCRWRIPIKTYPDIYLCILRQFCYDLLLILRNSPVGCPLFVIVHYYPLQPGLLISLLFINLMYPCFYFLPGVLICLLFTLLRLCFLCFS